MLTSQLTPLQREPVERGARLGDLAAPVPLVHVLLVEFRLLDLSPFLKKV